MAIIKNKGETVLNDKLFLGINILKIVKYLVKFFFYYFSTVMNGFIMMRLIGIMSLENFETFGKKTKK